MKKWMLSTTALTAGFLPAMLLAAPAYAQSTDNGAVETVVVTGFRASLEQALELKREAIGERDSIVAEDIGKYPALNIADSLLRVPGVVLSRDGFTDEGKQVTVRGMNSTYTIVTVNGLQIHTETGSDVGNNSRAVDLDEFSPDLFSRVDFYKTPEADLTAGGIGGVIDMRTAHPFDYQKAQLHYSLGESYNDYREQGEPRATVFASDTWGPVGALISLSANKTNYEDMGSQVTGPAQAGCNEIGRTDQSVYLDYGPGTTVPACPNGKAAYAGVDPRANIAGYSIAQIQQAFVPRFARAYVSTDDRTRYSGDLSLEYKPSERFDLAFDLLAADMFDEHIENTFGMYFRSTGPTTAAGYAAAQTNPALIGQGADSGIVPVSVHVSTANNDLYGTFANTDRYDESRFYDGRDRFISGTLSGKYAVDDNLSFDSVASMARTDGFESDNRIVLNLYNLTTTYDPTKNPKLPELYTPTNLTNVALYSNPSDNVGYHKEGDRLEAFHLNGDYKTESGLDFIGHVDAKLGIAYDGAEKDNDQRNGDTGNAFANTVQANGLTFAQMPISSYAVPHLSESNLFKGLNNGGLPTEWVTVPRSFLYSLNPNGISASTPPLLSGLFKVTEAIESAYAQVNTDGIVMDRSLRIGLGLRYSQTHLFGHNYVSNQPNHIHNSYDDLLPSLAIDYNLEDDLVLRASYGKTITRVALGSIAGGVTVPNSFNLIATTGNPNLAPQRASNFDFSTEWYFADQSVLSLGLFYKEVKGLISSQQQYVPFGQLQIPSSLFNAQLYGNPVPANTLILVTHPINLNPLAVKGAEFFYQEPFTFLPDPFDGLGTIVSFTYTLGNVGGAGTGFTADNGQVYKLPINGLSKYSYSATLYYEKNAYSVRATYSWNSAQTTNGIGNQNHTNLQQWQAGRGQLDASLGYKLSDTLEVRLDGSNLLNEVAYQYFQDPTGQGAIGARVSAAGIGSDGNENVVWNGRTFILSIRGHL